MSSGKLRDTSYATVLASAELSDPNDSGDVYKAERIRIKEHGSEEIRFSWWRNGNIVPRPLDLESKVWAELFTKAIAADVFPHSLTKALRAALA